MSENTTPPGAVADLVERGLALADACARQRQPVEMEQVLRQLLAEVPDCAAAWNRLGILMAERGNALQAVAALERALALAPQDASCHANLAEILRRDGLIERALALALRAVELGPQHAVARLNLGYALLDAGRHAEAAVQFENVLARDGENARAWFGLGRALAAGRRHEAAADALERVVALVPADAEAWAALARARLALDDPDRALAAARRASVEAPGLAVARLALADALAGQGLLLETEQVLREGLRAEPASAPLAYRLALCRLAHGDYRDGFALFEARLAPDMPNRVQPAILPMPLWAGEDLRGRRLLVLTEQGYGDHLQYCRFGSLLAERGVEVTLGASPPMRALMRSLPGCARVLATLEESRASGCDYWTFVGSLPHRLGIDVRSVAPPVPYLCADSAKRAAWRERLARLGPRRRVGLVWAGRPEHDNDRRRSIPFAALAPLASVPEASWIGLQTGPRAADAAVRGAVMELEPWGEELRDFDDTAALIAELDLVISVDTATAHLAGALGQPVWTLLSQVADWRWGLTGASTPWYPVMRLFRQPARGDWAAVMRAVPRS